GATPSPEAVLAIEHARVAALTGDSPEVAAKTLESASGAVSARPLAWPTFLLAWLGSQQHVEIVFSGERGPALDALVAETRRRALPTGTVRALVERPEDARFLGELAKGREPRGAPCVYVCVGKSCRLPVSRVAELAKVLDELAVTRR